MPLSLTSLLIEYVFGAIIQGIACSIYCSLLYRSKIKKKLILSPPLLLYFCCNSIQSFFGFSHFLYLTIFWSTKFEGYNAFWLYSTGIIAIGGLIPNAVCISLLSIDRILILSIPLKYGQKQRIYAAYFVLGLIIIHCMLIFTINIIPSFPSEAKTLCKTLSCLMDKSQVIIYINTRYSTAAINVILSVIYGVILKKFFQGNKATAKLERLVLVTLILAFIFDFCPHFIGFILDQMKILDITAISGPHSLIFGAFDIGICSLFYLKDLNSGFTFKNILIRS